MLQSRSEGKLCWFHLWCSGFGLGVCVLPLRVRALGLGVQNFGVDALPLKVWALGFEAQDFRDYVYRAA